MQVAQIRDKYKRILQEPEEEDDNDEWEVAYSQLAKNRRKKVLTQASLNASTPSQGDSADSAKATLKLKQKLAQCLSNCKEHSKEIENLKRELMVCEDQKVDWRQEKMDFLQQIQHQKQLLEESKEQHQKIQAAQNQLKMQLQEVTIQKELQQKQADFYKAELNSLQMDLERNQKQFKHIEKDIKLYQKLKRDNDYLKADVERLSHLVENSLRFGRVSGELMKKHFLGKPHRELDFWYPHNLIGEVQHFLKKSQVGHGNKEFTSNLVKFIEKIQEKAKEEAGGKIGCKQSMSSSKAQERDCHSLKKTHKLNILDVSSTKKHTCNLSSMRDDYLLRANTNSFWKASQSRIVAAPTSSNIALVSIKSQCWDVVNEFRSVVFELLLEKDIKRKKVKKLIDSMSGSLMELFQSAPGPIVIQGPNGRDNWRQMSFAPERKDEFGGMRIMTQECTAALK